MDKDKANKLLELFGRPAFKTPNGTVIAFARQDTKDVTEIEKMTNKELVEEWKSLVWLNHIYGQVSLNEMQRISLLELEMDTRKGISPEKLCAWYDKAQAEFDKAEEANGL